MYDAESLKALECGLDMGVNFIDTADMYGTGHSEKHVAQGVKVWILQSYVSDEIKSISFSCFKKYLQDSFGSNQSKGEPFALLVNILLN